MLKKIAQHILRTELAAMANKEETCTDALRTANLRGRLQSEEYDRSIEINNILEHQNKELTTTNEIQLTAIDALTAKLATLQNEHTVLKASNVAHAETYQRLTKELANKSEELSDAKKVPSPAMSEICHTCLKQQPKAKGKQTYLAL